jgi:prefoldin subunit 5
MSRSDLAGYPTKDTLFESQTEAITSYMDYLQSRLSELTKRLLTMRELRATLASVKKK